MSCPLLSRARPECRAVAGGSHPVTAQVIATYCRAAPESCPAYRYLRATGGPAHPADFRAWVLLGVRPGRTDPEPVPDLSSVPDPG